MGLGDVYCIRCGEATFPVSNSPGFRMGELKRIVIGLDNSLMETWRGLMVPMIETNSNLYICGNCYFDLTDDTQEEDKEDV